MGGVLTYFPKAHEMTRIIAGTAKGQQLAVPDSGTRPTTDRAREAIFSAVEAAVELPGATVLDVFSGSGAFGLEARSRGAERAWCIESNPAAAALIRANAAALGMLHVEVIATTAERVFAQPATPAQVSSIVLMDPPYDIPTAEIEQLVLAAARNGWFAIDALIVLERGQDSPQADFGEGFTLRKVKRYGRARVESFYFDGFP